MSTLAEIEAAAERLTSEQKAELIRFLSARLYSIGRNSHRAQLVREGDDLVLQAPPDAPPMTPEVVKQLLEDFP